jgi:hypothetical protein
VTDYSPLLFLIEREKAARRRAREAVAAAAAAAGAKEENGLWAVVGRAGESRWAQPLKSGEEVDWGVRRKQRRGVGKRKREGL